MIPLEDAQSHVMKNIKTLNNENVHLLQGRNRAITEPILSNESIPPFDNTAVDGYAVKAIDTKGATPVSYTHLTLPKKA